MSESDFQRIWKLKQTRNTSCNCRIKNKCPLEGKCCEIKGPVVYKATLNDSHGDERTYIGSSVNFKERYRNHTKSFRDIAHRYDITLANLISEDRLGSEPNIKWSILAKTKAYQKGGRYCDLCLTEKLYISKEQISHPFTCLNKRSDLTNKCIHKSMYRLTRVK